MMGTSRQRWEADVSRARDELDWTPEIPFDRGLRLFLDWFERLREVRGAGGATADTTSSRRKA